MAASQSGRRVHERVEIERARVSTDEAEVRPVLENPQVIPPLAGSLHFGFAEARRSTREVNDQIRRTPAATREFDGPTQKALRHGREARGASQRAPRESI